MSVFSHPEQYELWADLSLQNRHLRRNNWLHWGIHLALVASLVLFALRPLVAIRVDQLGRAELVESVAVANSPGAEEAEHVARLFSQYLLEVTSGSVSRDLSKAMALMTTQFQGAYRTKLKEDPSLGALEKGNVRTQVSFDDTQTVIKAEKDASGRTTRYFAELWGKIDVYRADVLTSPLLTRLVHIRATLLVVPRSHQTLNGLLVDWFEKEYQEPPKSLTVNVSPLPLAPVAPSKGTP